MPDYKGGGRLNINGQQLMVMYTLSGHAPSEDDGKWATSVLKNHIAQALAQAPDLAAAAADPSAVAQAAMGAAIPTLMQRGIVGALRIDGIRGPAGAPIGGGDDAAAGPEVFELKATVKGPGGGFESHDVKIAMHGSLGKAPKSMVSGDLHAMAGMALMNASSLEEASAKLTANMAHSESFEMFKASGRFEVLSFEGPLGTAIKPKAPAAAAPPPAAFPAFEPEQFASLDVELDLYPGHEDAILSKYGVEPAAREALANEWRNKLADPALEARYRQAYERYKAWLQSQQQQ